MGEQTFESIDEAAACLEMMVNELDVATLTGAAATRLVTRLITAERILASARARATKRAADANQWRHAGERSPASWAARLTGTTTGQAASDLETEAKLAKLPASDAARRAGKISDLQARELAAAATADPMAEAELLRRAAIDDAAAFRRRCAEVRAAAEKDEAVARERIRRARRLRSWIDAEGAFCFTGRGPAEDGAALLAAMKPYQDRALRAARNAGDHDATEAYAYDGLLAMARHDADHECTPVGAAPDGEAELFDSSDHPGTAARGEEAGAETDWQAPSPGGGTATTHDPSRRPPHDGANSPPRREGPAITQEDLVQDRDAVVAECLRPGPRAKLIVRIDHGALVRGHTLPGEVCEIVGVGPVTVAAARELARDAFLTAVVTDGVDITKVVHLGRSATAHQRTALEARGVTCAVPGCGMVHGLEIDHFDGWAITRTTRVEQLDWLCHFHHGLKTTKSYRLGGPPGARTWHPPGDHVTAA